MNNNRLLELDALRGLAALSVVFYHYLYRYNDIYGHESLPVYWASFGKFGVELFFMVSGFVIFWTLNRVKRPLDFIVSRFSRLYPVYWLSVFITFMAIFFWGLPGREVSVLEALANVLMFHEYFSIPHVDGVYWTLTIELTFYFWMFSFYLISKLDRVETIFSMVVIASVLNSLEIINTPNIIYKIFIMKHMSFFLAGISFYKIVNNQGNIKVSVVALLISLFSTLVIYSIESFYVFIGFYTVFYMALTGKIKALSYKPLVYLGGISYSLYLLHQNIGYIIINKFYELLWNPILGVLVAIAITIILAILSRQYVELPLLNKIRKSYNNSNIYQKMAGKLTE